MVLFSKDYLDKVILNLQLKGLKEIAKYATYVIFFLLLSETFILKYFYIFFMFLLQINY